MSEYLYKCEIQSQKISNACSSYHLTQYVLHLPFFHLRASLGSLFELEKRMTHFEAKSIKENRIYETVFLKNIFANFIFL